MYRVRIRDGLAGLVSVVVLLGCAGKERQEAQWARRPPAFANEEQKLLACLDLRDHIVDLYASEYVANERLTLTARERVAFRDGWAEELAKRGTFERFEQSCSDSLTPNRYRCGMASHTTDGLVACMKSSSG
ncbi:MAG: hypothetical protein M3O50_08230 [Myxococcota bacterium]|nr:hypothetical protein [Myxococcota bacterium]